MRVSRKNVKKKLIEATTDYGPMFNDESIEEFLDYLETHSVRPGLFSFWEVLIDYCQDYHRAVKEE